MEKIDNLVEENSSIKNQLEAMKVKVDSTTAEMVDMESQILDRDDRIAELNTQIESVKGKIFNYYKKFLK